MIDTSVTELPTYAGVKLTLDNVLLSSDELDSSPSVKEGLTDDEEQNLRNLGCEYIQISGIMLRVPQVAMANAEVLFQRFYCIKSFTKNKMEEMAMACIWLASKIEEAPRRIRDVINVFHFMHQKLKDKSCTPTPLPLDHAYIELKARVIKLERRLLKELGFCVHVKHPHKSIVVFLKVLGLDTNRDLVQTAWNYMNDSLRSILFVRHSPETIACACIYLAARVLQVPLPNKPHWFYLFNATEEDIKHICLSILKIYQRRKYIPYNLGSNIAEKIEKLKSDAAIKVKVDTVEKVKHDSDKAFTPEKPIAVEKKPETKSHISEIKPEKTKEERKSNHKSTQREDRKDERKGDHKDDRKERRKHDRHERKHKHDRSDSKRHKGHRDRSSKKR